jgi:membrane protease YdiL (CAAX protease family)
MRAVWVAASATLVGLMYGLVARHTGSIRWTILSHILMNFAGLGVLAYFA